MTESAFEVDQPQTRSSAVVFASPHSGRIYPKSFLEESILDGHAVRSSEDAFVDQLFAAAPRYGAPLIKALAPRAFVDLNRSPDELDPATFQMDIASHPFTIDLDSNVVTWTFDNILLVDSFANEPESHGFIRFSIEPFSGLLPGDSIVNEANIYFDFNPAIRTRAACSAGSIPRSAWASEIRNSSRVCSGRPSSGRAPGKRPGANYDARSRA